VGRGWISWKYYVIMYENEKMRPPETLSWMVEGGIKDNDEGSEFSYDIYKNFCKCHNVPAV
jgi:hypothetical protein